MDDFGSILKFEHPKWKANLVENLTVLFQSGELCDLYILCKDQKDLNVTYPCHACILASASPVVRNVLLKNEVFGSWTKMALESLGISAREWQYILKYVYTGSVSIQEPHIYAVWKAALYLQIEILVTVLATCIHKYHTKEMELNSPVPELKVCPCKISAMGSVFVGSHSDAWQRSPANRDPDHSMIQFFPRKINRRETEFDNTAFNEDISRKRHVKTCVDDTDQQMGVIDLTLAPPYKSDLQCSSEVPQDCSSKKRRKMYTPRKVETKDKKSCEHSEKTPGSILASVLEGSSLDNSKDNGSRQGINYDSNSMSHSLSKDGQLLKTLMTQGHGCDFEKSIIEEQSRSDHHENKLLQKYLQNLCEKTPAIFETLSQRSLSPDPKNCTDKTQFNSIFKTIGNESKRKESVLSHTESNYTVTNPLVIQPLGNGEHPVMNLSLHDRCTSRHTAPVTEKRHHFDKDHSHVYSSHLKDRPLLSNLLRQSSDSRFSQLHEKKMHHTETMSSSVLKSLLVSNDNSYRAPNKNIPLERPGMVMPKSLEKKLPQFQDSSEDEVIFDMGVVDNIKSDPDYRPKKGKSQRKKTSSVDRREKSPVRARSHPSSDTQAASAVEPYSASSILLSMIRDAETKKGTNNTATECSKTTVVERTIGTPSKNVILQQPDMRPKERVGAPSETKGILRNLLNHKSNNGDRMDAKHPLNTVTAADESTDFSQGPKTPLKVPKPKQGSLPFSHVLKNLASAYSSHDTFLSALDNTVTETTADSVSGDDSHVVEKQNKKETSATETMEGSNEAYGKHESIGDDNKMESSTENGTKGYSVDTTDKGSSFFRQNWPEVDEQESSSAVQSAQTLKLTICKQGQEFKVKDEVMSPEVIETSSDTSIQSGFQIDEDFPDIEHTDENDSLSLKGTFDNEDNHICRNSSDQAIVEAETAFENTQNSALSQLDFPLFCEKEVRKSVEAESDEGGMCSDVHNFNKEQFEKDEDALVCDNSDKDNSDTEIESLNEEETDHDKSDTDNTNKFMVPPYNFPEQDSPNTLLQPSSPESHTLKINSYYSIAEPQIDEGFTIAEDGGKKADIGLVPFRSLFEKDCASSVSESCSDTEVALN